jgi:hypothetical protein
MAPLSRMVKAMRIGMILGLLEILARVAPSGVPANKPRTILGDLFTLAHIVSAAVWIGGLVGLVMLAVRKGVPTLERSRFWPSAIRRFSMTAMAAEWDTELGGYVVVGGLRLGEAQLDHQRLAAARKLLDGIVSHCTSSTMRCVSESSTTRTVSFVRSLSCTRRSTIRML